MIKLTIGIPTVVGRESSLKKLVDGLEYQIKSNGVESFVEIIIDKDNKEVSIGSKRNRMYENAKGLFTVMIDDDDYISPDYILQCLKGCQHGYDCMGYQERCDLNGIIKHSEISLKHNSWNEFKYPINGFHFHRSPFFKVPIKTELCRQ